MDLSRPISCVVPTLDGAVLDALARTMAPATGRQVHRMAGTGSEAGVRKVLTRLAEQGLVTVSQAGASLLYLGNRDHLAWPAVDTLTSLRHEFRVRLQGELQSWDPAPLHLSIFGSFARGDGGVRSDIDLMLVRPTEVDEDSEPWASLVDILRSRVSRWTGNPGQVLQLDLDRLAEYVKAKDPLVDEWRRDAITLHGQDPQSILDGLRPPKRRTGRTR